MYAGGRILAFDEFKLRKVVELDALKLFFLFVERRDKRTNLANIGYEKIHQYTGIKRERIKSAISFLASLSLVYVEQLPSQTNSFGISNAYRIVGIDSFNHRGTRGRGGDEADTF
jgi:RIO-like serine/threonine protein kinase